MIPFAMGLDAAIALFKKWRWLLLAVPLLIAVAVQSYRLNSAKADLLEKQAIISNMETASKAAKAAQIALNQATEAAYKAEAERTDREYSIALNDALRLANAYADRHRVRSVCEGIARQAGPAAEGNDPESRNGPGADAIVVSRADFETLNANTLRLKAVNEWGQRLIDQGLAEKP